MLSIWVIVLFFSWQDIWWNCIVIIWSACFSMMHRSEKEMNRRKDVLANLRSKVNQMASTLNMSNFANRDSLFGPEIKPDAMSRTVGLDNSGHVGLQRQIMKGYIIWIVWKLKLLSIVYFGSWFGRVLFKQSKTRALKNWRRL